MKNSSSFDSNDELSFLEGHRKDILLAKDTTGSGSNFFAEGFTPTYFNPPRRQTPIVMGGSNPGGNGNGGSSSAPNPGNSNSQGLPDPTPKVSFQFSRKKPKQSKNELPDNELQDGVTYFIDRDNKLIFRVIRDGKPYFIEEMALLKKMYHAVDFGVELPPGFNTKYGSKLPPRERFRYLAEKGVLPQKCVNDYMRELIKHVQDPKTEMISGTLGKKKYDPIPGTHAYNPDTEIEAGSTRRFDR